MSNIIDLSEKLKPEENKLVHVVKSKKGYCKHMEVIINKDEKTIQCRRCGYMLSSWEYISKLADLTDRTIDWVVSLEKKRWNLVNELSDIERKIKNAKSRLSRANKKERQDG